MGGSPLSNSNFFMHAKGLDMLYTRNLIGLVEISEISDFGSSRIYYKLNGR